MTPLYKVIYRYKNDIKLILVKDESQEPTNSIKYRPARYIIQKAYELNLINTDTEIVEVTSGNMGIALAYVAKEHGNPITIYMPKSMSKERIDFIKKLNANLVLTENFDEAFKLADSHQGFHVKQFENKFNAESYIGLCSELETKLQLFPAFIAGVGTSGTLTGVLSYLKPKYHTIGIAIEPTESLILSTGINHGDHEIEGLSDGFVPKLFNRDLVDRIISISSVDAIVMAQKLMKKFNLSIGISSGANFLGAVLSGINQVITVFPDHSNRYYSTRLFDETLKSDLVNEIELISIETL